MKQDLQAGAAKLRELDRELQASFSGPLVSAAGVGKVPGVLAGGVRAELWGARL